jgi:hypothetical protein
MATFKYQTEFSIDLTAAWREGKREHVRTVIRNLKNKAQASYIAAKVASNLAASNEADVFAEFMHPNNK